MAENQLCLAVAVLLCLNESKLLLEAFEGAGPVHQPIFSPSRIFLKARIGGNLTRIPSLESCWIDQISSINRAKALNEVSRLAREFRSLREILDGGPEKVMYNCIKSELRHSVKNTYEPMSSLGNFSMQLGQQLRPGEKVFGRSLLEEGLGPRYLDAGWPCSSTWNHTDISRSAYIVCGTAEGTPDVALTKARPRFGTESGLDEYTTTAQSQFPCPTYSFGLLVGKYNCSDTNSLSEGEIEGWLENLNTQTQPGIVPLLGRFGTLSPEPPESQLYHNQCNPQRDYGIFPNARETKIMKIYDSFIGDEGFGPDFGEPNMGREDDDDDNCVGFRRLSGLENRNNALCYGGGRHGKFCGNDLQMGHLRGIIPKFGPPKRDPVAAAIGSTFKRSADETTLAIWRDAIARTFGRTTGFGPMATNKGKETDWKSAWEMHGNARGEGDLMCAY